VVPDYHGTFATIYQCKARVIRFADESFSGSPALQRLDDEVERAYRTREDPDAPHLRAVTARDSASRKNLTSGAG
jgi:hypothetical protein